MTFGESLRKLDYFGEPVNLVYKGDMKFKTKVGGFTTMFIVLTMLSLFVSELIALTAD